MFGVPITAIVYFEELPATGEIITYYDFKGLVPKIEIRNFNNTIPNEYTISSEAFKTLSSFKLVIDLNTSVPIYILNSSVPTNVPSPAIFITYDDTNPIITFVLTSNIESPFTKQITYRLTLFNTSNISVSGVATPYQNSQGTLTNILAGATTITPNILTADSTLITSPISTSTTISANLKYRETINILSNNINNYIGTNRSISEPTVYTSTPSPRVIISALKTTNGLEVSEIAARVSDTMTYTLCNNKLSQSLSSSTTSILEIYHTDFSTVILGCGCTFVEKLISLVGGDYQVYIPILVYTILKYVIALLIYGDLNVKYLYRSFNNQFLCDLKNSRFSNFYEVFTVPNPPFYDFTETDQYFIWSAAAEDNCKPCYGVSHNIENKKPSHRIWNEYILNYKQNPVHLI